MQLVIMVVYISLNKGRKITLALDKDGYEQVFLRTKLYRVHRLVLQVFAPNPDYKNLEVNHLNGIKHENIFDPVHKIINLIWTTGSDNIAHVLANGFRGSDGEKHYKVKYTEKEI